jgi:hypothetical protein
LGFNTFVHGSNARQLSLTELAKMLCLSYYAYVFSRTKLEIRAEQVLPGSEWGRGTRERNDPNNVCTCE